MLGKLVADLHEMKHLLYGLAKATPGALEHAKASDEEDRTEIAKRAQEERRHEHIGRILMYDDDRERGPNYVTWFSAKIGATEFGPMRIEDVQRYNLDGARRETLYGPDDVIGEDHDDLVSAREDD